MQARNDFLDQGRYLEIDSVNSGKIYEFIQKGRQTFEKKKSRLYLRRIFPQLKHIKLRKKKENLQLEKKCLLGTRREDAKIKSKSHISHPPMGSAETKQTIRFFIRNKV